ILSYVTFAAPRSNAAVHLRHRWPQRQCDRFLRAIKVDTGDETDGRLAEAHYPSCPIARQFLHVKVRPVRLATIVSEDRIAQHCQPHRTHPLTGEAPAPLMLKPTAAHKSDPR